MTPYKSTQKPSKLNILFVLDPLENLVMTTDSSMALVREFHCRGHQIWSVEVDDIWLTNRGVMGTVKCLQPEKTADFRIKKVKQMNLAEFDLIVIRKEPPFDERYLAMTYAMDLLKPHTFLSNDPAGIRGNNEKLSSLYFKEYMPETMVTHDVHKILEFASKVKEGLVIKPLDLAGGTGVFRLNKNKVKAKKELQQVTKNNRKIVMAQAFIKPVDGQRPSDKRAVVLNGKLVGVYERRCKKGEFRANLHKGGTFHPCKLTQKENKIVDAMADYFRKTGLHFVGLDIIQGKLIEINVTCPGGIIEAELLYPQARIIKKWADFLERKAFKRL